MRLIDADSLKSTLEYGLLCNISADSKDSESEKLNTWIQDVIDKEPTVTPQEPKTGHWIRLGYEMYDGYRCSKCGCVKNLTSNFCPNCGADMRISEE